MTMAFSVKELRKKIKKQLPKNQKVPTLKVILNKCNATIYNLIEF
jgi:hypothetical protein